MKGKSVEQSCEKCVWYKNECKNPGTVCNYYIVISDDKPTVKAERIQRNFVLAPSQRDTDRWVEINGMMCRQPELLGEYEEVDEDRRVWRVKVIK